jgi:hypothetical protein
MSQPYMSPDDSDSQVERVSAWSIFSLILGIGSFCLWIIAGIPAIICGIIGLNKSSQPGVGGRGLAIAGIITGSIGSIMVFPIIAILIAMLLPAVNAAREAARRMDSTNKVRNHSLAMMMYQDQEGALPAAFGSADGPPLSWRMALAPYLEEGQVHVQYNFEQPWDSADNLPLSQSMPAVFQNPNLMTPGVTNYLVLASNETAFPPNEPVRDLRAASQTILIVEADEDRAVPWTKPQDIDYDPNVPLNGLGTFRPGVFVVSFGDASARSISSDIDPEVFRAMATRSEEDNDAIGSFFLE